MPITSIEINANANKVYIFLTDALMKSFKVSSLDALEGAEITNEVNSYGKMLSVSQKVTALVADQQIEFESFHGNEHSITSYTVSAIDDNSCTLTFSEQAKSAKFSRNLNYRLFSLPFFKKYAIKRMNASLSNIKNLIEQGGEHSDTN